MGLFLISSKLIILMTNEALKLMQSNQDYGLVIQMYTINILMDLFKTFKSIIHGNFYKHPSYFIVHDNLLQINIISKFKPLNLRLILIFTYGGIL
jgi:hypothetical protein